MELLALIAQAQQGEEEAFTEICRRFEGLVKKYAFQQHLRPIAEEAQAHGWLAVAEAVKAYNPAMGVPAVGYIKSRLQFALWNLFKQERRRWQTEVGLDGTADGDEAAGSLLDTLAADNQVEEQLERKELMEQLQLAVMKLPERQRQAIVYTIIQKQRLQQAAATMGVSLQAVHGLRHRGLRSLRDDSLLSLSLHMDAMPSMARPVLAPSRRVASHAARQSHFLIPGSSR